MERSKNRWKVLAAVCGGLFVIMLQGNIINIAVPAIQARFNTDLGNAQWVTNAYLLAFTMLLITGGRLGDALGRKKVFCTGIVFFVAGALWNAFASGMPNATLGTLLVGAVIQGIGGAAMMPATQALIAANFENDERAKALGIWGMVTGLAAAIGPTLGGVLTQWGLGSGLNAFLGVAEGWRYTYFLSALIGVVVFIGSVIVIPESKDPDAKGEYDVVGILLSTLAVFSLVFGLIKGRTYGWWERSADFTVAGHSIGLGPLSVTPLFFLVSLVAFVLLGVWEAARKKEKLIDFKLFRNRDFAAGSATAAILSFAMMGIMFLVPVFLQSVLKFTAVKAGLVMLPMALAVAVASPVSGMLTNRFGPRPIVMLGMAIMLAGSLLVAHLGPTTTALDLFLPFVVIGIGIGLANGPITNASLRHVDRAAVGGASGLISMIRQLGSVLGIAIFASAFAGSIAPFAAERIQKIDSAVLPAAISGKIVEGLKAPGAAMGQMTGAAGGAEADKMLAFFPKARAEKIKAAITDAMMGGLADSVNSTLKYAAIASALGIISGAAMMGMSRKKDEEKDGEGRGPSGPGGDDRDDGNPKGKAKAGKPGSKRRKAAVVALASLVAAGGLTGCATAPVKAAELEPSAQVAAQAAQPAVAWSDEARAAFEKEVPAAVRKMATRKLESDARAQGLATIDLAFYEAEKKAMGM